MLRPLEVTGCLNVAAFPKGFRFKASTAWDGVEKVDLVDEKKGQNDLSIKKIVLTLFLTDPFYDRPFF